MKIWHKIVATLAGVVLLITLPVSAASAASTWYVKGSAPCKSGYTKVQQYPWWDFIGAFGNMRWVCEKNGTTAPYWY